MKSFKIIALAVVTGAAISAPAHADCAHPVIDRCLVGNWKMTVNGAEAWMRANIHQARVTGVSSVNNTIKLRADGTFTTGASRTSAHVAAEDDHVEGTGTMNGQASGQWSVAGAILTFCPSNVDTSGSVEVHRMIGGTTVTVPMPHITPRITNFGYRCAGDTFTTTQPMPHGTVMTSTYVRMH